MNIAVVKVSGKRNSDSTKPSSDSSQDKSDGKMTGMLALTDGEGGVMIFGGC